MYIRFSLMGGSAATGTEEFAGVLDGVVDCVLLDETGTTGELLELAAVLGEELGGVVELSVVPAVLCVKELLCVLAGVLSTVLDNISDVSDVAVLSEPVDELSTLEVPFSADEVKTLSDELL